MYNNILISSLQARGMLFPNGEINNDALTCLSGTVAAPLVQAVWEMSDNNPDTLKRLQSILNNLYEQRKEREAVEVLRLLYETLGLVFPNDVILISNHTEARSYFLFELLADLDDILQELLPEG
jgi:hypothetical protein